MVVASTRIDASDHQFPPAVRAEILTAYEARLEASGNPIHADPHALRQALRQAEAVIDDVDCHRRSETGEVGSRAVSASLAIGVDRAEHGVHPLHSLRAASALFEAALPPLLSLYCVPDDDQLGSANDVATTLHRAIMGRITMGSLSYVGFLLERIYTSHLEERRRIARDLHDRVAHAVGIGLQHFDLHRIYQDRGLDGDPELAAAQLRKVDRSLHDAIEITRGLSEELRLAVGAEGLEHAVRGYLDADVPPGVAVEFTAQGDCTGLPTAVAEEVYVVLREAVRNALLHSGTDRLVVALRAGTSAIAVEVTDDGRGLDRSPTDYHSGGMLSMHERVELIGGTVSISDSLSGGTTVRVHVPLPGGVP